MQKHYTMSTTMFFSYEIHASHNNYVFNLRDQRDRAIAAQYFLNIWSNMSKKPFRIRHTSPIYTQNRAKVFENHLCLEIIRNEEALFAAISRFTQNAKLLQKQIFNNLDHNLWLLRLLTNNSLIIKHTNQTNLWKPFISAMLTVLSIHIPDPQLSVEHNDRIWNIFYFRFAHSVKYWKYKHLIFAVDNGLFKLMKGIYDPIKKFPNKKLTINLKMFYTLMVKISLCSKDIDRKYGKNSVRYVLKSLRATFGADNSFVAEIRNRYRSEFGEFKFRYLYLECGWPLCKRENFVKRNICKGCKLIQYCCRNHQKKHWKYIHSQQCKLFW
eukprot:206434_1